MKDIINSRREIDPRVLHLKPSSRGWVDFLRDIKAVTLFAHGLGDLIVPAAGTKTCRFWQMVPKGQDYLTTRIRTLQAICEDFGDSDESPLRLTESTYWHQADKLFDSCTCVEDPKILWKTCDRIQVLLPRVTLGMKKSPNPWIHQNGAVIFGRSERSLFSWPLRGKPVQGVMPDDTLDEEQTVDNDSGLGRSLSSTELASSNSQ